MTNKTSNTKVIPIEPYLKGAAYLIGEKKGMLTDIDKIEILANTFLIMEKSHYINTNYLCAYQSILSDDKYNIVRLSESKQTDEYYEESGSINGWRVNFTIEKKNIRGTIFVGCINGILKYSAFGLQKYKETKSKTYYYHITDGLILSTITCSKKDTFLEELNNVEKIEPFSQIYTKKYKIKRRDAND